MLPSGAEAIGGDGVRARRCLDRRELFRSAYGSQVSNLGPCNGAGGTEIIDLSGGVVVILNVLRGSTEDGLWDDVVALPVNGVKLLGD